jgi:hypothetical protein
MTPGQSAIARAVDAIEEERTNLVARLAKVDALLATMREAFHLAPARVVKPKAEKATTRIVRAVKPKPPVNGFKSKHGLVIQAALQKAGPMAPADLAKAIGQTASATRYHVQRLIAAGALVATGSTSKRRIALASAPKEAP